MKKLIEFLDDREIVKILDKRAFDDFWREQHSKEEQITPKGFPAKDQLWVRKALQRLDSVSQFILHLRFWEGLCHDEIAIFLRCRKERITKIEHQALKKLKEMYFEDNVYPNQPARQFVAREYAAAF